MPAADLSPFEYQLLDFGKGRKLEQFGSIIVDRYSPPAHDFSISRPDCWSSAAAHFLRKGEDKGEWDTLEAFPPDWRLSAGRLQFQLKPSPFGHLGIFPEQMENWSWIHEVCRQSERPLRVLNLFAYTGGSTLAATAAGAEVTHVDAAGNVVKWARRNAQWSSLADAPIRWITEDVRKFVKRERKREIRYDGVILDPPSYGHGAKGEVWRINRDLPLLLRHLRHILQPELRLVLLTCHSPGYEFVQLRRILRESFPLDAANLEAGPLILTDLDGRELPSGHFARWHAVG